MRRSKSQSGISNWTVTASRPARSSRTGAKADMSSLSCGAYALWADATVQIEKYGAMIKSPTGFPIQSPYLAIANRQAEIMMRIASEFGFTPASRSRIATPAKAPASLFDLMEERPEEPSSGPA
jgi:P27 family predicted phage terminase small subunit